MPQADVFEPGVEVERVVSLFHPDRVLARAGFKVLDELPNGGGCRDPHELWILGTGSVDEELDVSAGFGEGCGVHEDLLLRSFRQHRLERNRWLLRFTARYVRMRNKIPPGGHPHV